MVWPVTPRPMRPASISTTRAPASCSTSAAVTPTMPPPTTHTSAVTSVSSGANAGVSGAVSSQREPLITVRPYLKWHWFSGGTVTAMTVAARRSRARGSSSPGAGHGPARRHA